MKTQISLREWLVGQALYGVTYHYFGHEGEECIAMQACSIADAVIKELNKNEEK